MRTWLFCKKFNLLWHIGQVRAKFLLMFFFSIKLALTSTFTKVKKQSNISPSVRQCRLFYMFLFALASLGGSSWSPKTCLARDKANYCPLCPLAGRSGKTTLEEPSSSITRPEPHSGCGPRCSKN